MWSYWIIFKVVYKIVPIDSMVSLKIHMPYDPL